MRNLILAIVLWLIAAVVYAGNYYLGDFLKGTPVGRYGAEISSLALMVPTLLIIAWFYARQTRGDGWGTSAIGAGILWVGLSVIVKLIVSRYAVCAPPTDISLAEYIKVGEKMRDCIMSDYNVMEGKMWPVVLGVALVAPLLMGIKDNR
ncbi:hypothetical protein [Kamptonema formosum]|uniref:hypothetical protein n=1 Tax=Kamptonema formosum TaxID=331992 RepID=UPI0003459CB5|nr:hypothetical protein [Oscillatoria sp. PCC 10802]